jgi:predicted NBD/HSP70 family sugar kinase
MVIAAIFLLAAMLAAYRYIGWPPVIIVGGSGTAAFILWSLTYLRRPLPPEIVLPPFLLTVAALEAHMIEEYLTGFGPAMSRLFNISWSERSFLMIFAFVGPVLYSLTALGLFRRVPLAGFLMCFVLIGPGVAEFVHFIFPALQPDVQPTVAGPVQAVVGRGQLMQNLPNFWVHVTGRYYFPGMYTAILPMIPGVYGIRKLLAAERTARLHSTK